MPLVLGGPAGLTFQQGDGPNELPRQQTVDGQEQTLSDGARYFQDTGITPKAISWSGTFEWNDNFGSPDAKARYVETLRDQRTRTTLSSDYGWTWQGFVQDATMTPMGAGRVKYAITFEVEIAGTLTGTPVSTNASRIGGSLDAINAYAAILSQATQVANVAVQSARIAAGY